MDFLFDIGYVTNLAVIILVVGWFAIGFMVGLTVGTERAEKRAEKRIAILRAYYDHPSNQR